MRTHAHAFARTHVAALLALILALYGLAACGSSSPAAQKHAPPTACGSALPATIPPALQPTNAQAPAQPLLATDADGAPIVIPAQAPQRIVSLGPTDSEILAALKMDAQVVAVDYYTDYPADLAAKPKISDANGNYNIEAIVALKPDLVLSYGGETNSSSFNVDKPLKDAHIQVVDLPATDLSGSLVEMRVVGQLVHAYGMADALAASLRRRIDAVKQKVTGQAPVSVYMEVDDSTPGKPYAFGGGSFGDELIRDAGGTNIFASDTNGGGYPQVSDESIIAANPQVIILTEDPHFGGNPRVVYQRAGWSVIAAVKDKRVCAISPDLIQRVGPRIVDGLELLARDLYPNVFA